MRETALEGAVFFLEGSPNAASPLGESAEVSSPFETKKPTQTLGQAFDKPCRMVGCLRRSPE